MVYQFRLILISILFLSIAANFGSIWLAKKLKLIDYPGSAVHKNHKNPTPLSGGISIVFTFTVYLIFRDGWIGEKWIGILIGAFIIFLFGIWDDAYKFAYSTKLLGQIMGGMVLIASGVIINIFRSSNLFWLNWIVSLFWIVGIVNAFNFIDSMDNIVTGISVISFASLTYFFFYTQNDFLTEISLVLTGISIVSYFFNRTPAKMFLGDSGAQTLGFFVATLCILFYRRNPHQFSTIVPMIILLGVPIFNITLVVISRLKRGIPVYKARLDQIYHRLIKIGNSENTAVIILHFVCLILSAIAILTLYMQPIWVNVLFGVIFLIGIILILILDNRKIWL